MPAVPPVRAACSRMAPLLSPPCGVCTMARTLAPAAKLGPRATLPWKTPPFIAGIGLLQAKLLLEASCGEPRISIGVPPSADPIDVAFAPSSHGQYAARLSAAGR